MFLLSSSLLPSSHCITHCEFRGKIYCCGSSVPKGATVCADINILPSLPCGSRLELFTLGEQTAGVGGRLWNAAPKLCQYQLAQADQVHDSVVLELGSGTGACGLFAAGLGAAKIVVTDGGPPALLELLAYNVQCNADSIERIDASQIEVRSLRWGESSIDETLGTSFLEEMDWIFASDVTYDDDLHQSLCQTLRDLLLAGPNARAILCEEHGPPTPYREVEGQEGCGLWRDEFLESFVVTAQRHGLAVEPFVLEDDLGESINESRAFPMSDFATADVYLMEVRLTDARDVRAEEVVTGDTVEDRAPSTDRPPAPFNMLRNRDSWSE